MSEQLDALRRRAANLERDRYDFGGLIVQATDWEDDGRDSLTSIVEIMAEAHPRHLTFRVAFRSDSDEPHHVTVAERMTVL